MPGLEWEQDERNKVVLGWKPPSGSADDGKGYRAVSDCLVDKGCEGKMYTYADEYIVCYGCGGILTAREAARVVDKTEPRLVTRAELAVILGISEASVYRNCPSVGIVKRKLRYDLNKFI